jgi:hypothetical protein
MKLIEFPGIRWVAMIIYNVQGCRIQSRPSWNYFDYDVVGLSSSYFGVLRHFYQMLGRGSGVRG